MLIKVTNYCSMGCSHCMEDSTIQGEHMTAETFEKALDLTERVEKLVFAAGIPRILLLSGGECTEHPDFIKLLERTVERGFEPFLITNGLWLGNEEMRTAILRPEWPKLRIQVVNDPRFYPTAPPKWDDPRIIFADYVPLLMQLGRAKRRRPQPDDPEPRQYPASYNVRAVTRQLGSLAMALIPLRMKAKMCAPAISSNGDVVAGETRYCWKIGTVDSTEEELTKNILAMGSCNRCGGEDNLTQPLRRAIGLSTLYLGTER